MVTLSCRDCPNTFEAKNRRPSLCPDCKAGKPVRHEHDRAYWSPEAVLARKHAKEQRRESTLKLQAIKNAETAKTRRTMPFLDDADELDWLIKEQARDMNTYKLSHRIGLDTQFGTASWAVDNSFEENLDALCETW